MFAIYSLCDSQWQAVTVQCSVFSWREGVMCLSELSTHSIKPVWGLVLCVDNSVTAVPLIYQLHTEVRYDSTTRLSGQWPSCSLALPATSAVSRHQQPLPHAPQPHDGSCINLLSQCRVQRLGGIQFCRIFIAMSPTTLRLELEQSTVVW